jgi:ribosomal protein L9
MIKFTADVDGIFETGQTVTLEPGVEDAYVNYRGVAVYVTAEEQKAAESIPGRRDKMVREPQVKRKG